MSVNSYTTQSQDYLNNQSATLPNSSPLTPPNSSSSSKKTSATTTYKSENVCTLEEDFALSTKNFEDVIRQTDNLADRMDEVKRSLENKKNALMDCWAGLGRNTYEKKFHLLVLQLEDLASNLHEIADGMVKAEEAYIQADTDLAKTLDGTTNRY